jgi:hypothetical protein
MNKIVKIAIVMAMMMSATFAFGQDNTTGSSNPNNNNNNNGAYTSGFDIYVKAKLPAGAGAEVITATITLYKSDGSIAKSPRVTSNYTFNTVTNTFEFFPERFEYGTAAYAEICVKGYHHYYSSGKVWVSGGKAITISSGPLYNVEIDLANGDCNCPHIYIPNPQN